MKARMRFHAVAAGIILAALSVCPPQARAAELEAVTWPSWSAAKPASVT